MNDTPHIYLLRIGMLVAAIACLLVRYGLVYSQFAIEYTDFDQLILWVSALEYAQGNFHEPNFYGQSYNSTLEGLLSAPFNMLGYKLRNILPLVSIGLNILPIIIIMIHLLQKGRQNIALVILSLLLLLPTEYYMITSLPRGFVTGVGMMSLAILVLNSSNKTYQYIIFGISSSIAYILNPNSILLSAPLTLYFLYLSPNRLKSMVHFGLGLLPGILIYIFMQYFHYIHPEISVFRNISWDISYANFSKGILNMDGFFRHLMPASLGFYIFLLFAIGYILLHLYQKKIAPVVFMVSGLVIILLSLSMSKVHDCNSNILYPCARMYLGFPVFIMLALYFSMLDAYPNFKWAPYLLIPLGLLYSGRAVTKTPTTIDQQLRGHPEMLYYVNTDTLYHDCQLLKGYAERNAVDLIVLDDFQESWVYACPCIEVDFPEILLLKKDRRYWKLFSGAQGRYHTIAYLENTKGNRVDIIPPTPYRVETWGFNYISIRAEIFQFAPPISSLTFFKLMGFEHRAVYTARSSNR